MIGKQLSTKQLIVFCIITAMASRMFMLPVMLLRIAGRDSIIVMAVHIMIELAILAILLIAISKGKDADLFDALTKLFKKTGARVFYIVLALYFFVRLLFCLTQVELYYRYTVFENFNWKIMIIPILALCVSVAVKQRRTIGRVNELSLPIIAIAAIALLIVSAVSKFDLANVLPLLAPNNTVKAGFFKTGIFMGDFIPVLMFMGNTENKSKKFEKPAVSTMICALISSLIALMACYIMCCAFGNMPHLTHYGTSFANVNEYGLVQGLGRLDMVIYTVWTIAPILSCVTLFWCVVTVFARAIGVRKRLVVSLITAVAVYFSTVLISSEALLALEMSYAVSAVMGIMSIIIPIIALIASIINDKSNDKMSCEQDVISPSKAENQMASDTSALDNCSANNTNPSENEGQLTETKQNAKNVKQKPSKEDAL